MLLFCLGGAFTAARKSWVIFPPVVIPTLMDYDKHALGQAGPCLNSLVEFESIPVHGGHEAISRIPPDERSASYN
jgi:hypothetical protein